MIAQECFSLGRYHVRACPLDRNDGLKTTRSGASAAESILLDCCKVHLQKLCHLAEMGRAGDPPPLMFRQLEITKRCEGCRIQNEMRSIHLSQESRTQFF